jgi:hypothetical protein
LRATPCDSPSSLTYRHRAGVSLYTSTYVFAQTCVFDKQSLEPIRAAIRRWHSLSRSYGVILQSSLTTVLPSALGYSPRLPVLVLVRLHCCGGFSWLCFTELHQPGTRPCGTGMSSSPILIHTTSSLRSAGILTCCPSSTPFGLD